MKTSKPATLNLVNTQVHRHSYTCHMSKTACRFNYPQPPMRSTEILYPFDSHNMEEAVIEKHKSNWNCIQKHLNDLKEGEDITFNQLLSNLKLTEEAYMFAISILSINAPTIFLRRQPNELTINNYNPACLNAWWANMDIQLVLDVYGCAMYIVFCISKVQKGMSDLLRAACNKARTGNANR